MRMWFRKHLRGSTIKALTRGKLLTDEIRKYHPSCIYHIGPRVLLLDGMLQPDTIAMSFHDPEEEGVLKSWSPEDADRAVRAVYATLEPHVQSSLMIICTESNLERMERSFGSRHGDHLRLCRVNGKDCALVYSTTQQDRITAYIRAQPLARLVRVKAFELPFATHDGHSLLYKAMRRGHLWASEKTLFFAFEEPVVMVAPKTDDVYFEFTERVDLPNHDGPRLNKLPWYWDIPAGMELVSRVYCDAATEFLVVRCIAVRVTKGHNGWYDKEEDAIRALFEKLEHQAKAESAAVKIGRQLMKSITDPAYTMCKRRLQREFEVLIT